MSDRPSWMPSRETITDAYYDAELEELIEVTGLRAQIEALCSISGKDVIEIGVAIGDRLDALYARLAELEGA